MSQIDLDKLKLPALPATVRECIAQIYNADVDLGHISQIAQKDVGLVSSLLKVANSSAYASTGKPTSDLKTAMTRIGLTSVVQIFVSQSIENTLKVDPPIGFFNIKAFTKHCSWVSQIAFEIAKFLEFEMKNDLLISGLVHDIGLLAQAYANKSQFKKIIDKSIKEKKEIIDVEKEMKIDLHDALGGVILERWKWPEEVITIVKYHHTPESARDKKLTFDQNKAINILILADLAAHRFGNAYKDYPRSTKINKIDLEKLELTNKDLTAAVKTAGAVLANY